MEVYQTTEDIKEEVVDYQDEYQLCTACLCATRTTRTLDDDALKQYYMHILTEMEPEGGVVLQSPRVCWECVSHLKRSVHFREQVQDSYRLLQPTLSMCNKEDLDEYLQTSVCRPGRLKTCVAHSIDISPQDEDMLVMTVTKHDEDDEEAVIGRLKNDIERRSAFFRENDPSEALCDEKYDMCDLEGVVQSPLMCNYNIDNYQDHESKNEQLDETDDHLRKVVLNNIKTVNTPTSTSDASRDLEKNFFCDYCYKGLTSKAALERHIATCNIYPHNNKTVPSTCKDCAVVLRSDMCVINQQCSECRNKQNLLQHNNKPVITAEKHVLSNECNKSFSVEANIPRDEKVHSAEKPFQCEMCHKSFARKGDLVHHKIIHTGEKPFQCKVCHKSFARNGDMIKHKMIHTGEKPFRCKVCHKSFARNGDMIKHNMIHTGEKPFQCKVCHKSFAHISNLIRHNRTHTGENPFQCQVCHKTFTQISNLNTHKVIHTGEKPFQCKVCHKSFAHINNLNTHKRIHTGEKPFQCKVCYKSFAHVSNLVRHNIVHTGEKHFQCKVCHKSFAFIGGLMRHKNKLKACDIMYIM